LAYLVDGLIVGIPIAVLFIVWTVLTIGAAFADGSSSSPTDGPWFGIGFGLLLLAAVLYDVLFLRFRGATPGKMLLGIRVRLLDRPGRLPWGTIVVRLLVQFGVPGLLAVVPVVGTFLRSVFQLLDGLWPLWDGRRQALHDKAARTVVVLTR
jgi:uncharacterized RDD family membrane protein YckC